MSEDEKGGPNTIDMDFTGGRAVPTVIVTGYAVEEAESINALRAMNVTGCLVKPFDPAELAQALEDMSKARG